MNKTRNMWKLNKRKHHPTKQTRHGSGIRVLHVEKSKQYLFNKQQRSR